MGRDAEKDSKNEELEKQIAALRGDLAEAKGDGGTGLRLPSSEGGEESSEVRRRIDALEQSVKDGPNHGSAGRGGVKVERKPISEYKVIQNIAPLTEDKGKFREWNTKFINAMDQVDSKYQAALMNLMKWADAEAVPDMESGWPGDQILREAGLTGDTDVRSPDSDLLNVNQLEKDLRGVLIEKAVGTVHTRVMSSMPKGGVYAYVDVYRHFTEMSGLGLTEQAGKLMDPTPAKRGEEISDRVEDWIQKCDRLARHGVQYELATVYKVVALGKRSVGEAKKSYEQWKVDGLPYEKLVTKVKDYSSCQRLAGDAKKGKQAVDLNAFQDNTAWGDESQE